MPDFHWNTPALQSLMAEAGDLALSYFHRALVEVKADHSLVTEADVAVEEVFRKELESKKEGRWLIGEESVAELSDDEVQLAMKSECYVVDPIDGTINYANGTELWGVSLGRMVRGELVDGAIYMPVLRELYFTEGDEVFVCSREKQGWGPCVALTKPINPILERSILSVTQMMVKNKTFQTHCTINAVGVAIYPLLNLMRGRFKAYIGRLKLWDMAGALPMLHRLGLEARFLNGEVMESRIQNHYFKMDPQTKKAFAMREPLFFGHHGDFDEVKKVLHL